MHILELIRKKKQGGVLTTEEINYFVDGYVKGMIPDYQAAALLMAICWQGMDKVETAALTMAYVDSGERLDLSGIEGIKVDKHSTGGVGDKVSLVIIPLLAAAGAPVAKLSGRGLGHTGGTIDKLESIAGFRTELSLVEFVANVNKYKMAIMGQSDRLTPADKLIYALRDVTATVDSIPLIAASVMSKKIAAGADAIVLDVKTGSGSFMKTAGQAEELARAMVRIGCSLSRRIIAVITDMNQPLGREVGNANEVREAIEVLQGRGPEDLTAVSLTIGAHMAVLGGVYQDFDAGYKGLEQIINNRQGLDKLKQLITAQGGDSNIINEPEKLPQANAHISVKAPASGYVAAIDTEMIGVAAMLLGAGRKVKEDRINPAAGLTLTRKIGEPVVAGETICTLHTDLEDWAEAAILAERAYSFSDSAPAPVEYIRRTIGTDNFL
ncbi:MAG: pyrimidine-nucleoside phosphorylase [Peptococcaceae bacterium]|nr:pyrimidine-nucleoside phosphorylase [Peptococcaceae bacterium]